MIKFIKFIKVFLALREWRRSYMVAANSAVSMLMNADSLVARLHFDDLDDSFIKYTSLLDFSEEMVRQCQCILDDVHKLKNVNSMEGVALTELATIYELAAKRTALVGAGLSIVGEFNPTRAKEVLDLKIEYPTFKTAQEKAR